MHIYDGPVSYRLEWNGLCFVFSGDTTPNQIFVDHAKGADLLIHEAFNTVSQLVKRSGFDEKTAQAVGTIAHAAPDEAGHVLDLVRPRLAVLYHFFNDFDTVLEVERDVRKHYRGPLALAQDFIVFNITASDIRVRMAVTPTHVWPNKEHHDAFRRAPRRERPKMSRWLADKQLFPKF